MTDPATTSTAVHRFDAATFVVYSFVIFFPRLIEPYASPRVLGLLLAIVILTRSLRTFIPEAHLLGAIALLAAVAWLMLKTVILSNVSDLAVGVNADRSVLITPVLAITGFFLARASRLRVFLIAFGWVGALASVLALVELLQGRSLFGFDSVVREQARSVGTTRALVASDHVLVLGALLAAAAVGFAVTRTRWWPIGSAITLVGCYSTGSRGPIALAAFLIAFVALRGVSRRVLRGWIPAAVLVAVLTTIAVLAYTRWTTYVAGTTGEAYSANYRPALYAFLPSILREVPFGYGFRSVPKGTWLLQSQLLGTRDITETVDSEVVYSAFTFGIIGVAIVVGAMVVAARASALGTNLDLPALTIGLSGLFLALHAWDSIGQLWLLLTGAAIATVLPAPRGRLQLGHAFPGPGALRRPATARVPPSTVSSLRDTEY